MYSVREIPKYKMLKQVVHMFTTVV